jgi:SAM-dependent methyltransferase
MLRVLLWAALVVRAGALLAQDPGPVHDAPFLPSPRATVGEMLRLAAVGAEDVVYDLGSGDGRVVIAAARDFGARGVGVEINAALVAQSRASAEHAGVSARVRFVQQNLFETALDEATVIALYLSPNHNLRLRPVLLRLRPGTRIVAHGSDLGDWKPDRSSSIRKDVRVWLVPAQVSGRWRAVVAAAPHERTFEIELSQRYQEVSASAQLDGAAAPVWEAKLEADRLSFVIVEAPETDQETALYFEGRVRGDAIEGVVARGVGRAREVLAWRATRVAP